MNPAQKLIISNFSTGYETDREPFLINNDAFPVLQNAYVWRGKILKKRGTFLLGRLQRYIPANGIRPHTGTSTIGNLDGSGNLAATSLIAVFSLQSGANIVPGSISFSDGTNTYTDNSLGIITGVPGGTGTINYVTSFITITGGAPAQPLVGYFQYYPNLPVMGLEDFNVQSALQPILVSFDTVYAYQFDQSNDIFYDVSFYKNPASTPKANLTPLVWSGQNYQQFWSTNYYGAMWVTNNKPGFHFVNGAYSAGTGTPIITFVFTSGGNPYQNLVVGDRLWFNEWSTGGSTINGLTGIVTTVVNAATGTYQVTFTGNQTVAGTGIAQLLTNSISGQDGIRWYDGDPNSNVAGGSGLGWVNFAPPLDNTSTPDYLVGALAILPFKDRLLFFAPYVQKSSQGSPTLYQDRVIYSQNGTPFYTTLVPSGQTAPSVSSAWYQNVVGFGGFVAAGIQQPIVTVTNNEDVLLVDFTNRKTKLVYTSNDLIPFLFYNINSELGTQSTFSAITLDAGALSMGQYGIAQTDQNSAQRIDLLIPDQIFEVKQTNFGVNRVCAIRDFRNEFIYFTYPADSNRPSENFPTQTLVYNYRDNNWAIFIENYTTYGNFRYTSDTTWQKLPYTSWSAWTDPWNSGKGSTNYPYIAGGNQQGFVMLKDDKGITEAQSQYIQSITISGSTVTINSPNHSLATGDYIYILGCIGISDINETIRQIIVTSENEFRIDTVSPNIVPSGTYLGGGTYARLTVPVVQSKQFPVFWPQGRRARIGTQRYLFDETSEGEVIIGIFVDQNGDYSMTSFGANQPSPFNSGMVYTQIVLTSPEPSDLFVTQYNQAQIWHVMNSSLVGDTVQFGLTLSDTQMRDYELNNSEIVLHAIVLDLYPSGVLGQ